MENSQPTIIEWFEREINNNANIVIIYRKHPAETIGEDIIKLTKKYPKRFYCIDDFSVRHWIHVSDICMTWFSTTSLDIYYAEKPCIILRPVPIDREIELETMYNVHKTQTYEEFHTLLNQDIITQDNLNVIIQHFICNQINELVLDDYVNAFIKVAKCDEDDAAFVSKQDSLRDRIAENIMGILCDICKYIKIAKFVSFFSPKIGSSLSYYQREVYGINTEIKRLERNTSQFIKDYYSKS